MMKRTLTPGKVLEAEKAQRKTGRASWRPASALDFLADKPGFRKRWIKKDPDNIVKKRAEGWQLASDDAGTNEGLTTVNEYRDLVGAYLSEEIAQARDEWVEEQTQRGTLSAKEIMAQKMEEAGVPHRYRQIIE